jgi:antitoxin component HigA of HigAB toxin-antitoxin module
MDRIVDLVLFPISLFSGKTLAVSIALTILGAAFFIWTFIHYGVERRFLAVYKDLANFVNSTRKSNDTPERKIAKVGAKFKKSALASSWEQYSASIDYADGHVFNYTDPAIYFASDRVTGHNYVKWSSTLGGVFLTVGLFFTFVGLSAALLQVAGDGHTSMLPEQLRHAVENILGISSVKFITSLAGILAYIFWSLVARFQADAQDLAVDGLVSELRGLSTYFSPEKLLQEQLKTQKAQHQQFQTFGTDLAVAIGQQIENALKGRLDPLPNAVADSVASKVADAMSPVRDELLAIGRQIGKAGGEIATGAGDVFSQVWKTGIETHMNAFGEQMATTISALQSLPEKVRQTEAGLGGEIGNAATRLTEAVARLSSNFETQQTAMRSAVTDFNSRVADIPNIVAAASRDSAAAVGRSVEASLGNLAEITAKAGQASAEQLSSEVAKIAASLAASADGLRSASDHSSEGVRQARDLLESSLRTGVKIVEETSLNSSSRLEATISSLSNVVNGLSSRLDQTTKLLEVQQSNLAQAGDVVSSASTSLSHAAGNVERAASPLTGAVNAIRTAMDQVVEASKQLRDTAASEQEVARMLNGTVEKAGDAFSEQAEKFAALQAGVRETMVGLVNGVAQLATEISTCIETYDSEIAKSMSSLENAILDVADIVEPQPKIERLAVTG